MRAASFCACQSGAFVRQQVAEVQDGIVDVVAEYGGSQMLEEDAPDGRAAVEDAAVVAGTGPQLVALLRIVQQRAEERRAQRLGVVAQMAGEVARDEVGRLLGQEDVAVDAVEDFDRDVFQPLAPDQHQQRHLQTAAAHQRYQRCRFAQQALLAPVHHDAADRRVGLHRKLGIARAARAQHREAQRLDLGGDLLQALAFQPLFVEGRR